MVSTINPSGIQPGTSPAPLADRQSGGPPAGPRPIERRVFTWCCVAIAAHIVIDAYVDLRPGTSPLDHPISGTVPLLGLAALFHVFQRARAGVAAMIALQLGVTAIIAGVAPVSMLVGEGRIAPGPLTGVVGSVAGAVLVGLGATMLWRNRRADGGLVRRWGRRLGLAVLSLALLNLVSVPVAFAFTQANWSIGYALDEVPLGPAYERIDLTTTDGLSLAAAYRPSQNGAAVIVFPGRRADHEAMLADHGYGVLVLEPRGRNDSEGDPPFVWTGEKDLRAAVRYLGARPDVDGDRIGGIGFSHGGLAMIQAAAGETGLRAIVSEGGSRRTVADHVDIATATFPPFSLVATVAMAVFSDSLPPRSIPDLVDDIGPRSVMLIWAGAADDPEGVNLRYFERAGEPKSIWHIPESAHTAGLQTRPAEYEQRVMAFFNGALLRSDP